MAYDYFTLVNISVEPIDGVRIVASCRTERLALATGDISHRPFTIPLFTDAEVRALVERRVPGASADEIAALQERQLTSNYAARALPTLRSHAPGSIGS